MNIEEIKELVANDSNRIKLYDKIAEQLQAAVLEINEDDLSTNTRWSSEEFVNRIKKYDKITKDLRTSQMLTSYWMSEEKFPDQFFAVKKLATNNKRLSGLTAWIALRWYPVTLLLYTAGISSVLANKYENLYQLFNLTTENPTRQENQVSIVEGIIKVFSRFNGDPFEILFENKNLAVPRSEYLLSTLKPEFEEHFFVEDQFENVFDIFEILLSFEFAHQQAGNNPDNILTPIGRFRYKGINNSALNSIILEANRMGMSWAPIKAGFWGGNFERFQLISGLYLEQLKDRNWF